jgi:hypothetical protein
MKLEISEVVRVMEEDKPDQIRVTFYINGTHGTAIVPADLIAQSPEIYTKYLLREFEQAINVQLEGIN